MQIEMTKFGFLLPGAVPTPDSKNEMLLASMLFDLRSLLNQLLITIHFLGSILETATLLSAKKRDMDAFSRNMAQLKPYYQSKRYIMNFIGSILY